jgi:hypothetical protein
VKFLNDHRLPPALKLDLWKFAIVFLRREGLG